jgi:hypothetical protein
MFECKHLVYFLKPVPSSGSLHHWQQDPPHPEVQGPGPRPTRGHVLPHQEGRLHPQASGAEQEGQGRQVQAHSRRVQDPPSGQVRFLTPFSLSYFPVFWIRDIFERIRIQIRGFVPHALLEIVVFLLFLLDDGRIWMRTNKDES